MPASNQILLQARKPAAILAQLSGMWGRLPGITGTARLLYLLEKLSFFLLLVIMPFRLRTVLLANRFPGIYWDYTDVLLYASDVALAATLLFWGMRLFLARRPPKIGPWFLAYPLAALTFLGLTSAIFSIVPGVSLYNGLRMLGLFLFYLYCTAEIHSIRNLAVPIGIQVLFQAFVGVAQYLQQHSLGAYKLGELVLETSRPGVAIVWAPGLVALRAYGLTDHANILGGALCLGLVFMAGRLMHAPSARRPVFLSVAGLGALGLLFSFSRAAWLALAAAGIFLAGFLAWRRKFTRLRRLAFSAAGIAVLMLPFLIQASPYLGRRLSMPPAVQESGGLLLSPEDRSFAERAALLAAGARVFSANALSGVGLAAGPIALQAEFPDFPFPYQPVHFILLEVGLELGLFGALCYFMLIAAPFLALAANRKRLAFSPALLTASAALLAAAVLGVFDYYLWLHASGRLWQWLVWGAWAAFYRRDLEHG